MTAGLFFDWDADGFSTGANDDCTTYLIHASYRRGGAAEITGSAQAGSATFLLKNTDGRFNPDNAAGPLYGKLRDGVPVWFGINADGTLGAGTPKGRFAGRITDISPLPAGGATDAPTVEIVCEDPLGWYARTPVDVSAACVPAVLQQGALLSPSGGGFATSFEMPFTPAAGSFLLAYIGYRGGAWVTLPGWTLLDQRTLPGGGTTGWVWRVADGTEQYFDTTYSNNKEGYVYAFSCATGAQSLTSTYTTSPSTQMVTMTASPVTASGAGLILGGFAHAADADHRAGGAYPAVVPDAGYTLDWTGQEEFSPMMSIVSKSISGAGSHTPAGDKDGLAAPWVYNAVWNWIAWAIAVTSPAGAITGDSMSQGELRAAILAAISETRISLANEVDPLAIGLISGTALDLLTAINQANGTRHFVHPADTYTDWYAYTTRDRHYKNGAAAADVTLSGSADHLTGINGWRLTADTVINRQAATIDWPEFPLGAITVWEHEGPPFDVTVSVPFELDLAYPDYVMDPELVITSTGATLTGTLTDHGYGGHISLTVASGTAVVTGISIIGREAVREPQQTTREDDTTSQTLPRGIREGSEIRGDLVGCIRSAEGITQHVVWRYASPQKRPQVTTANWTASLSWDLYDLVTVTSPQLDASAIRFEIVGISETVDLAASATAFHFTTVLTLQEARLQAAYNWFVLGTSTLNGTHDLAY